MNSPTDGLIISHVGSSPLIAKFCDELDFSDIIDRIVRWDPKQCQTSPSDAFNDDALGRALDKVAEANPKQIYGNIVLSAVTKHEIRFTSVHADTTSKSVYGAYENSEISEEEDSLFITHGYSKDHRPDLKQFMYGLITNNEGIPLYGELRDGNSSDKTWNHEVLKKLHKILPTVGKDSTYIADSALITKDNLAVLQSSRIST